MAATLTLRVRGPKGQFTVDSLSPDSAVSALVAQVAAKAGLAADGIQLLAGFPPQPLDTHDPSRAVGDVVGRERLLTVRESAKAATQAVARAGKNPTRRRRAPQSASAPTGGSPQKRRRGASNAAKSGRAAGKKSLFDGVQGEGDVGSLLAASAAGGRSKAHRVLRKANRLAVNDAYEESRANRRFRAALAGTFVVSDVDADDAEAAGSCAAVRGHSQPCYRMRALTQPRGPAPCRDGHCQDPRGVPARPAHHGGGGGGRHSPRGALCGSVGRAQDHGRRLAPLHLCPPWRLLTPPSFPLPTGGKENLKPHKLARISPRVFWNIARLFNGDVAAGLRALLPGEDWSFLASRARRQSAKARANALQEEADARGISVEEVEAEVRAEEEDPGSEEEGGGDASAAAAAEGGHMLGSGLDTGEAAAQGGAADDARRRRAAAAAARVAQQSAPGPSAQAAGAARSQGAEGGVREVVDAVVDDEGDESGEVDAVLAKVHAAGATTVGRLADLGDAPLVANGACPPAASPAGA